MNLLKQHKIKYLHYLHFLPLFSSLSLWLGDTSFAHLNIQCSFVVIVHKAVIFLWEAKANIALAAQCGRISLNTVSAASSLGLPWEMCNHVFAYINWGWSNLLAGGLASLGDDLFWECKGLPDVTVCVPEDGRPLFGVVCIRMREDATCAWNCLLFSVSFFVIFRALQSRL